jgi:hypothetical protein
MCDTISVVGTSVQTQIKALSLQLLPPGMLGCCIAIATHTSSQAYNN